MISEAEVFYMHQFLRLLSVSDAFGIEHDKLSEHTNASQTDLLVFIADHRLEYAFASHNYIVIVVCRQVSVISAETVDKSSPYQQSSQ